MKKLLLILTMVATLVGCASTQTKEPRKIAVQTYSLKDYTLEETMPILKTLGVDAIGASQGQQISKKYPGVYFNPKMNAEQRAFVKKLLADNNIKIASFGVTGASDEKGIIEVYKLASEMGAPVIITEATEPLLPLWAKYSKEYGIKMCFHNHASDNKNNNYYNPKVVAALIAKYPCFGACADNGHWARSGIATVYGYKILEGKMDVIHFKDQKEFGNIKNQPVVFGKGVLDNKACLAELDRQGYKGYFVIEYEVFDRNTVPEMKECVEFLRNN